MSLSKVVRFLPHLSTRQNNDLSGHYFHTDTTTSDVDFATKLVSDIFKCQPERGYYKHANEANNRFLFKHNFRFWNTCDNLLMGSAACFMPLLSEQSCPLFPIRTIKLVRMRMKHAKMLFDDPEVGKGLQIGNSNSLKPNQAYRHLIRRSQTAKRWENLNFP